MNPQTEPIKCVGALCELRHAVCAIYGFGIAIDIAAAHSHYWLRAKPGAGGHITYKNEIPREIVRTFEAHGFIRGGKWYHYDTMHFEYRPELIGAAK
ncbi:MAG TPA: M15 family metallopeptidase [Pseudolabrys sp.]|nr:M15 family metallopeptidase [Pseudolabrys sp.]